MCKRKWLLILVKGKNKILIYYSTVVILFELHNSRQRTEFRELDRVEMIINFFDKKIVQCKEEGYLSTTTRNVIIITMNQL